MKKINKKLAYIILTMAIVSVGVYLSMNIYRATRPANSGLMLRGQYDGQSLYGRVLQETQDNGKDGSDLSGKRYAFGIYQDEDKALLSTIPPETIVFVNDTDSSLKVGRAYDLKVKYNKAQDWYEIVSAKMLTSTGQIDF